MSTEEQTTATEARSSVLMEVSNAMVALHKGQFGRGPSSARSAYAGDDTILVTLHGGMVPAERALVELDEGLRVQESRLFFQEATRDKFMSTVESITGRKVATFASACDPRTDTIWEIFGLQPR